jgi:hypothetical protein
MLSAPAPAHERSLVVSAIRCRDRLPQKLLGPASVDAATPPRDTDRSAQFCVDINRPDRAWESESRASVLPRRTGSAPSD